MNFYFITFMQVIFALKEHDTVRIPNGDPDPRTQLNRDPAQIRIWITFFVIPRLLFTMKASLEAVLGIRDILVRIRIRNPRIRTSD